MKKLIIFTCLMAIFIFTSMTVVAYDFEAYDLEGQTVRIGYWQDLSEDMAPEIKDRINAAEKEFDIKIEFVRMPDAWPPEDYIETVTAGVLAGDPPADMIVAAGFHYPVLAAREVIYPVQDLLESEYFENSLGAAEKVYESATIRGNKYGVSWRKATSWGGAITIWNQNLFEAEGVRTPYELMESEEWTWENAREIAKKITKDTNGDGEIDQWGFAGNFWAPMLPHLLRTNGASLTKNVDGNVVFAGNDSEAVELFNILKEIINEDETFNMVGNDLSEFNNGNVAMHVGSPMWTIPNNIDLEAVNFGVAPLPLGPSGKDYTVATGFSFMTIPITEENPKALLDLHKYMWYSEEGYKAMELEEKENFAVAQDSRTYEMLQKLVLEDAEFLDLYRNTLLGAGLEGVYGQVVLQGERDAASALDEIAPAMNSALESFLDQW